jgi:D-alanine-D-alanine ligase
MKQKKNIALVTGGWSGERVISLGSAEVALKHIDAELYSAYKIVIDRKRWYHLTADGKKIKVNKNDFSISLNSQKIKFDAALIILHGTPGEDGKLQGYFDTIGLPYTSCDAATSAITFNKRYTVATAAFSDIRVAKSLHIFKGTPLSSKEILSRLQLPVFVKPNNGGSSVGMSRVAEAKELNAALKKAFKEDDQILVEEYIKGREFTVGVMKTRREIVVLPICEVRSKKAFFDYEAKYEGASEELIPAPIDESMRATLADNARRIYQIFNCKGIVRIDFIWQDAENVPYLLEVNTVPGQSEASIVPQMVRAHGWTMKEFYTRQLEECF